MAVKPQIGGTQPTGTEPAGTQVGGPAGARTGTGVAATPTTTTATGPAAGLGAGPAAAGPATTPEALSQQRVIRIPIAALREGVSKYNVIIRPGDIINVPPVEPGEFYLMGHVARPGVYTLTGRKITLKQAVASAGGLDALAIPRRCDLIRRIGTDQEATVQVNLQAIFDGEQPDLFLKPNDVVNVGTDAVAPFLAVMRNAYRASYGWGFTYDENFNTNPTPGSSVGSRRPGRACGAGARHTGEGGPYNRSSDLLFVEDRQPCCKLSENPPMRPATCQTIRDLTGPWWVAHTKARVEKAFAWDLVAAGINYFLPLVRHTSFSGGRKRLGMLPLFPSYVFFAAGRWSGIRPSRRTGCAR